MTRESDGSPPFDGGGFDSDDPLSAEGLEALVEEAAGHPDRLSALVRQLVLQTIEEVRDSLDRQESST